MVPVLAVAVVLSVSGVHGRRTHDPERAARALEILTPTDDTRVAIAELDAFFQTGWVGWDVKTQVEIACGTTRPHHMTDPVRCVQRSHGIVFEHLCSEQTTFRNYTILAWSALVPGLVAVVLGAALLAGRARRKVRPAPE